MSDFKKWKQQHEQSLSRPATSKVVPTHKDNSAEPSVRSTALGQQSEGAPTMLTSEAVKRLDQGYLAQVAYQRGKMSRPPSDVGSVRSSMSSASMIDRLAQVETALTTMSQVAVDQHQMLKKQAVMLEKQDRLLTLLSKRVIGDEVTPDDSASQK